MDTITPIDAESHLCSPDDLAMAQFSSGTTVAPKPVGLTYRQVLSNTDIICSVVDGSIGCSWLPLYDMGLIGCIFPALSKIGTMVLIAPEDFSATSQSMAKAYPSTKLYFSSTQLLALCLLYSTSKMLNSTGWIITAGKWHSMVQAVAPKHCVPLLNVLSRLDLMPTALCPVYGLAEAWCPVSHRRTPCSSTI